jgi:hypothetical protein
MEILRAAAAVDDVALDDEVAQDDGGRGGRILGAERGAKREEEDGVKDEARHGVGG